MRDAVPVRPDDILARLDLPAGRAHHNSRLVERQSVLIAIDLRAGEEGWIAGRVTDISRDGCRLAMAAGSLHPGMAVRIMFPGFAGRGARIVWTEGDRAGCLFERPMPSAILDYIIRMSDPSARG
ncbi:MAG: PilZ domain-containing protein [Sphingobium sp.]